MNRKKKKKCYGLLTQLKQSLKDIAKIPNDEITHLPCHFNHMQWYLAVLDAK